MAVVVGADIALTPEFDTAADGDTHSRLMTHRICRPAARKANCGGDESDRCA